MTRFTRFFLAASAIHILLLLTSTDLYAQSGERSNALEKGSWALLFQVDGRPSVDFFDGMLAVKYHPSATRAIRIGIGGNASTADDASRFNGGISLQGQYFVYPRPEREINFYVGLGPRVTAVHNRVGDPGTQDLRRTAWELGLAGGLGVEWFVMRSLSLMGEYGNFVAIRTEMREQAGDETSWMDYFYRSSAKLGIAAYF